MNGRLNTHAPTGPIVALINSVARRKPNPYKPHLKSLSDYQEFGFGQLAAKVAADFGGDLAPEGKTILDLGCGNGAKTCYYAQALGARRVIGIDILAADIQSARRFAGKKNLTRRTDFVQAFCPPLPIRSDSVDIILSNSVLEHVAPGSLEDWCRDTHRVLVHHGRLFLRVHPFRSRFGGHHMLYLPLPWLHLWMPEKVILDAWRSNYAEARREGQDRVHDPSIIERAETLGDLCGGLNRLPLRTFENAFLAAGYIVRSKRVSNRKWTGRLCRWSPLADFLCDNMTYVLEKP